jgi:hypothetical protein
MNLRDTSKRLSHVLLAMGLLVTLPAHGVLRKDPPASIHGAVYVPSNAITLPSCGRTLALKRRSATSGMRTRSM